MAASNIDEALRQITAVGGDLKEVAILDNFCWGDTDQPPQLGGLVRAAYGCYDASKAFGTPFVSGKDSLHNEYVMGSRRVSIPGTLLISAISVVDDVAKCITMDLKEPGSLIYVVGMTFDELGGSYYYGLNAVTGNSVPVVDFKHARSLMDKLAACIRSGLVNACHDCSEGGIGVAAAEMAFAGRLGAEISLRDVPYTSRRSLAGRRNDYILFSESNTRFIVEVSARNRAAFEKYMKGFRTAAIGRVLDHKDFVVYGLDGKVVVRSHINEMKEAWQSPLRW
jgi:phosphoribosylformylglycinamidine synthase